MICNKCNHTLPNDSEFCQYCGNRLEIQSFINRPEVEATRERMPISQDAKVNETMASDEVVAAILDAYVKNTVETMETNSLEQSNHEGEADFGLVPEKPIYTIALKLIEGKEEYLNRLYAISGEKINWKRRGSTSVNGINGLVDIYDTYLPSGQFYQTIYLNMYGAKESQKAPRGFTLSGNVAGRRGKVTNNKNSSKTKYCKHCGSKIDDDTKICVGCGKKYLKITKFYVIAATLSIAIIALTVLSVVQFHNNRKLQDEIIDLEWQITQRDKTVDRLERDVDSLETRYQKIIDTGEFFDKHAVIVEQGSQRYHKYGCINLDGTTFWIYNIEAAKDHGYYACPKCY